MAEENDTTVDLDTFVPEGFKGEDGVYDTEGFRASYDELSSFKAQADEVKASLPESPEGYVFAAPEGHEFPEGFDAELFKTVDDEGNDVEFDVNSLIDADDPDVAALQSVMHEAGVPQEIVGKLASIQINRELRGMMKAQETAKAEKEALGPQSKERLNTLSRTVSARVPKEQAKALMDSLTSANSVRALEALLKANKSPITPAPGKKDFGEMSPMELLELGSKS